MLLPRFFSTCVDWLLVFLLLGGCLFPHGVAGQQPEDKYYRDVDGLASNSVFQLRTRADGKVWMATSKGISSFNGITFRTYNQDHGLEDRAVFGLRESEDGTLYAYTYSGDVYFLEKDSFRLVPFSRLVKHTKRSYIMDLAFKGDTVWIGYTGNPPVKGIGEKWELVDEVILEGPDAFAAYRRQIGHHQNLIGYVAGGIDSLVFKLTDSLGADQRLVIDRPGRAGYIGYSFLETREGYQLFCMENVMVLYDPQTGSYRRLPFVANFCTNSIFQDAAGYVWVGTFYSGVYQLDPQQDYMPVKRLFPQRTITAIAEDREGGFWFSIIGGGVLYVPQPEVINYPLGQEAAYENPIHLFVGNDSLWVQPRQGNVYGLKPMVEAPYLLAPYRLQSTDALADQLVTDALPEKIIPEDLEIDGLGDYRVLAMVKRAGWTFVGTETQGLIVRSADGKTIQYDGKGGEDLNIAFQALAFSSDGDLWAGTNRGVYRYAWQGDSLRQKSWYRSENGFSEKEINALLEHQGKMWVAGKDKLWSIPIAKVLQPSNAPLIEVTQTEVQRGAERTASLLEELSYEDNNIYFHFQGTLFQHDGKVIYEYRLKGLTSTFQKTQDQTVFYPSLPSGDYTFEVRIFNGDGIPGTATVHFTIPPPFWKTWWFILLEVITVSAILYFFIDYRNYIRNERYKLQLALAESEQNALSAQINPRFLHNSLRSAISFILKGDASKAADHLASFSVLMRLVLRNTRNSKVTVKEEVEILRQYLELQLQRFDDRFQFQIEVQPEVDQDHTILPTMLIHPHIENAIWHGLKMGSLEGTIKIGVSQDEEHLYWNVEDNGVGRAKTRGNSSHRGMAGSGIAISKNRIDLLNKGSYAGFDMTITDLLDEEKQPSGTQVVVKIPRHFKA